MLKRESGVLKATGSYRTYSIPGKTAAIVPEFAAKLQLDFCACGEGPALGQNTIDDDDDDDDIN